MELNEKFYLVGHSMGAYLTANYAVKYQDNLKRLLLLSPPGVALPGSSSVMY